MLPNNLALLPHEIAHYQKLEQLASECVLFLRRENEAFPIEKPCKAALFGNGVRYTAKGGTGSGDVNSHFFTNIEEELENNGFEITTKKWLDAYDKHREAALKEFINQIKVDCKNYGMSAPAYSVGQFFAETNYDIPVDEYDGDIAIYVLSRVSGEGADRKLVPGDVFLTETEIKDILYLNEKYDRFMLVLNVSGIVDLSKVQEVKNILLLSQLGVVTSQVLANVILGKANPCGKLSDTWAEPNSYHPATLTIDMDDTKYEENIYVGYRYFDSANKTYLFPFGFGLSYSKFESKLVSYNAKGDEVSLKVNVKNVSKYDGKEVIQVYLGMEVNEYTPKKSLVAFKKTGLIKAGESEVIELSFKLSDFPIYNEKDARYELKEGWYLISFGNSSDSLEKVFKIHLKEDVAIKQVTNITSDKTISNDHYENIQQIEQLDIPCVVLDKSTFKCEVVEYYDKYRVEVSDYIKGLSVRDLIHINLGDYKGGIAGVIGQNGSLLPGAAGETTLRVASLNSALSMVDGPAGLRLVPEYKLTHKGTYDLQEDSIWKGIKPFLPSFLTKLLDVKKNHKKKGNIIYQYCTAIPIATALAQSFNVDLLYEVGRLVAEEMKIYDADIWLAPGMNIHRSILCGRNFEYYSEDPYLTGVIAASLVNGVQSYEGKMCCIKHYCCNNIETNRFNNSSSLCERTLREIYLPAFEYAIKHSNPATIMSSYNLVNGVHTSCNHDLLTKVLRCEMKFKGLVMTDWIVTGQINYKKSKHPCKYAHQDLVSGVNICMPGSKKDIKDIEKALKANKISVEDLQNNAEIVYRLIVGK